MARGRIIRGSGVSDLVRQPGGNIRYKQDGSIEGLLILSGDNSYRTRAPIIGQSHPDETAALCYDVLLERTKQNKVAVTASYIGVSTDPTPWFLEGTGSLDKESILTHPDFVAKIGGTKDSPKNNSQWDPDTGEFLGFPSDAPNTLGGVESWFVPSVVYRFTRWTYTQPTMDNIGKIQPTPISVSKPPNVKNFLAGPVTYRQIGRLYQVTSEFWGSGPNGWNNLIYAR